MSIFSEALHEQLDKLQETLISQNTKLLAQQARIDELMLEYCPDEMTEDQKSNWARHQVPVSEEDMPEAFRG